MVLLFEMWIAEDNENPFSDLPTGIPIGAVSGAWYIVEEHRPTKEAKRVGRWPGVAYTRWEIWGKMCEGDDLGFISDLVET